MQRRQRHPQDSATSSLPQGGPSPAPPCARRRPGGLRLALFVALLCDSSAIGEARLPTLEEWDFPTFDGWAPFHRSPGAAAALEDLAALGVLDASGSNLDGGFSNGRQLAPIPAKDFPATEVDADGDESWQPSGSSPKVAQDFAASGVGLKEDEHLQPSHGASLVLAMTEENATKEILVYWHVYKHNENLCFVPGVSCANGYVTKLDFHFRGLVGSIPAALAHLRHLEYLDLGWNKLTGTIPPELGDLSRLRFLRLQGNELWGQMPSSFSNLSALMFLHLGVNSLTGSFPADMWRLSELRHLNLGYNKMSGTLHQDTLALRKIRTFTVEANQFSGNIPPNIPEDSRLQIIRLRRNRFTGSIPGALMLLRELDWLDLAENKLTGSFPPEVDLGRLLGLHSLVTESNKLTGTLPDALCAGGGLSVLNVGRNKLSGKLPAFVKCQTLSMFGAHRNRFTGSIPRTLVARRMVLFDAHDNRLDGPLPDFLFTAPDLYLLDVSSNLLTGALPHRVGGLEELAVLRLRNNSMTGTIPDTLCKLTKLTSLVLSNNMFSGSLPRCLSELTALTFLVLHHNWITGTLLDNMNDLSDLKVLTLHRNRLSGTIPVSLDMPLSLLTLHENSLKGQVPPLSMASACVDSNSPSQSRRSFQCWLVNNLAETYGQAAKGGDRCGFLKEWLSEADQKTVKRTCAKSCDRCNESQLRVPKLTLHHNRLSCQLPELNESATAKLIATVIMGNMVGNVTNYLPNWVAREERQVFLYSSGIRSRQVIQYTSVGLVVPFILSFIFTGSLFPERVFAEPSEEYDEFTLQRIRAQVSVLRQVRLACCIGIGGLAPVYYLGATYFECGAFWSKFSCSTLMDSPVCALATALLWGFSVLHGFVYVDRLPSRREATSSVQLFNSRRIAEWFFWMCIVLMMNVPTVAWTFSQTLPLHSRLPEWLGGLWALNVVRLWAPTAIVLVDVAVAMPLAQFYSKFVTVREEDLIVAFRTFNSCVLPIFCCIMMHENCRGGWKVFWEVCETGSERWREFNIQLSDFGLDVLEPVRDICTPRPLWWLQGRCTRAIVQTLMPLMVMKIALKATVEPAMFLTIWVSLGRLANSGFRVGDEVIVSSDRKVMKAAFVHKQRSFEEHWEPLLGKRCLVCAPVTNDMRVGVVPQTSDMLVADKSKLAERTDITFLPCPMVQPTLTLPKLASLLLNRIVMRTLHPRRQFATLVNYSELLFLFGLQVPILMPLLYHAAAMNLLSLTVGLQRSGACMEGVRFGLPKQMLFYRILAASLFQCWFALDTRMYGLTMLVITTITLCVMIVKQRLKAKPPSAWRIHRRPFSSSGTSWAGFSSSTDSATASIELSSLAE